MANRRKKTKAKSTNGINTNGVTPNVDTRNRIQMRFWLDAKKDNELQMIKDLHHFKSKRKYADTIRKALSLFFALLLGEWAILNELFPGVVAAIGQNARVDLEAENARLKERIISLQAVIAESDDYIAELEAENDRLQKQSSATAQPSDAIQQQLDRIERQLLAQGHKPIDNVQEADVPQSVGLKAVQPVSGGLKPIGAAGNHQSMSIAAPVFDEDDSELEGLLEVKKDESAAMRSTQNFLKSLMNLAENPSTGDGSGLSARQRASMNE